jgi:hypothetical protein
MLTYLLVLQQLPSQLPLSVLPVAAALQQPEGEADLAFLQALLRSLLMQAAPATLHDSPFP